MSFLKGKLDVTETLKMTMSWIKFTFSNEDAMLNEDLAVRILQLQEYHNEKEDPTLRYNSIVDWIGLHLWSFVISIPGWN